MQYKLLDVTRICHQKPSSILSILGISMKFPSEWEKSFHSAIFPIALFLHFCTDYCRIYGMISCGCCNRAVPISRLQVDRKLIFPILSKSYYTCLNHFTIVNISVVNLFPHAVISKGLCFSQSDCVHKCKESVQLSKEAIPKANIGIVINRIVMQLT